MSETSPRYGRTRRTRPLGSQPSEQAIQRAILQFLRFKKILCWKNSSAGIYVRARDTYMRAQNRGSADILGVLPGGRFIAVEVKKPGGRVAPHQQAWLDQVRVQGGMALLAYSVEDVDHALEMLPTGVR